MTKQLTEVQRICELLKAIDESTDRHEAMDLIKQLDELRTYSQSHS